MKRSAAEAKVFIQKYEMETLSELEALAADVAKAGRPALLPLDRSYASLDRIEDYYFLVLDRKVQADKARATARVARYAGATVIEQAGGRWVPGPDDHDPVAVTKLRAAPKATYLPTLQVGELESYRYTGLLRDRTERHDLELQRRTIASLSGKLAETLVRLRADAKEVTRTDPGALDSTAALTRYESALGQVRAATASRELRRSVQRGTAIAIGNLMQAELGHSDWTVEEDPRNVDFGAWRLFGVLLTNEVERFDPAERPDGLRTSVEKMINYRRKKA